LGTGGAGVGCVAGSSSEFMTHLVD
jgi:hypothetical protein